MGRNHRVRSARRPACSPAARHEHLAWITIAAAAALLVVGVVIAALVSDDDTDDAPNPSSSQTSDSVEEVEPATETVAAVPIAG